MTVTVSYIPYEYRNHQRSFESLEQARNYWEPLEVPYQIFEGITRLYPRGSR